MNRKEVTDYILKEKIVVIIRTVLQEDAETIVEAMVEAGIKALEITSNTPGYEEEVAKAREKYPDILIGTGTVTTPEIAEKAIKAGAQFLVTPNTNPDVVACAHEHDVPVMMGAMTPTEVSVAVEAGADVVKLFPAESCGVKHFKGLKGPFKDTIFFAVGGIGLSELDSWFGAGIAGVGVGGNLTNLSKGVDEMKKSAKEMLSVIEKY